MRPVAVIGDAEEEDVWPIAIIPATEGVQRCVDDRVVVESAIYPLRFGFR